MSQDVSDKLQSEVVVAIAKLWEEGCPVASRPEEMAPIAIRRWKSAERRGIKVSDREGRVRDLTKGLIAHFEKEPDLVGPLRADYECVAERVAKVIAERVSNREDPLQVSGHIVNTRPSGTKPR